MRAMNPSEVVFYLRKQHDGYTAPEMVETARLNAIAHMATDPDTMNSFPESEIPERLMAELEKVSNKYMCLIVEAVTDHLDTKHLYCELGRFAYSYFLAKEQLDAQPSH